MESKFIYCVHNSLPLFPVLNQMNPDDITPSISLGYTDALYVY
jgi:hypothetical protein